MRARMKLVFLLLHLIFFSLAWGETDPDDLAILEEFRKGLDNPSALNWPSNSTDPCGTPQWPNLYCSGSRVVQIQVQNAGLSGTLPESLSKLSMLTDLGLQGNKLRGKLPSFSGLSNLQKVFLDDNLFDTIPSDFFVGLTSLEILSLSGNSLNLSSGGWELPQDLASSAQLRNISLINCGLVGSIPDYLGTLSNLEGLMLSYNNFTGGIPASFANSTMRILWLNNQGSGLSGSIDVIASMTMVTDVWLHANEFSGPIPEGIRALTSLKQLWLFNNRLVGLIPVSLTILPKLESLRLENNMFMGPIPKANYNFSYDGNSFCSLTPGESCSPEVTALLDFLAAVNYPPKLAAAWSGNDACAGNWSGISCSGSKTSVINLPHFQLNGTISPSLGNLDSLVYIRLGGNNLTGTIPSNLTYLKSLKLLNVSSNNLLPPVPAFPSSVTVLVDGNPLLDGSPSSGTPDSPGSPSSDGGDSGGVSTSSEKLKILIIVISIAIGVLIIVLAALFLYFRRKGKENTLMTPTSIVVHPRGSSDPDNMVKIAVANNINNSASASDQHSGNGSGTSNVHVIEAGSFVISVQVLRNATREFSQENVLGRGGFGVVYKGDLHDGTIIAVKRMEAGVVSSKATDEFQAEIDILTKVRHRNLVSILGYSIEGNEKLLVYEYMDQGALSKHLFQWKQHNMEPLSWKKRLNIALDVARGMEYLHSLANQCFIHRDLKSSNILLDNDYRAKVSDFGLVKLAPDGKNSVATRLAGTFGYLAPEYAVTGKITTKADVFSYGVVLMELVTGMMALDEERPEETRYLASWFCQVKNSKEKLKAAIDPSIDLTDEIFESIRIIAELAGHCTAREPNQRPDMGHAVNVLAPLVEKWKPTNDEQEEYLGIDLAQPLLQMVKGWQAADGTTVGSFVNLDDSKESIPARPAGFAESFTSADGR
ncbi:receptor-like kinase TMK3 [Typha latifolia]|uniref:receptor-like kinase TMK3 n=1 Tax=Typha latifolia TaxID=4733 RepID=UPI003C2D4680